MPLVDMIGELSGSVAGIDYAYARTLVQEAFADVKRLGGWSWQMFETGFTVPGMLGGGIQNSGANYGTVTLQFGQPTVIGDMDSSVAWATQGLGTQYGSLLTQRQFRSGGISGAGTIYNIIAADFTNPLAAVLTLDRPFTDPLTSFSAPVTQQIYSIYQPYIVAPFKDFVRWLTVYDIANCRWLFTRGDRRAQPGPGTDPQRQIFYIPSWICAFGQDERPNSSTYGWQRYELWPGPQNQFLYQAWGTRNGPELVNMSDELPIGIPESMVKARARVRCYEQAEANKDSANPRGAGADYRFLMEAAEAQYKSELKEARKQDRDRCDLFFSTMHRFKGGTRVLATFNSASGGIQSQVGI